MNRTALSKITERCAIGCTVGCAILSFLAAMLYVACSAYFLIALLHRPTTPPAAYVHLIAVLLFFVILAALFCWAAILSFRLGNTVYPWVYTLIGWFSWCLFIALIPTPDKNPNIRELTANTDVIITSTPTPINSTIIPDEVWEKVISLEDYTVEQERLRQLLRQYLKEYPPQSIDGTYESVKAMGYKPIVITGFNPDNSSDPYAYSALTSYMKDKIKIVADVLKEEKTYFIESIRGYTDSRPLASQQAIQLYSNNNGLAEKRAREVAQYLSALMGYNVVGPDAVFAGSKSDRFGNIDISRPCVAICLKKYNSK